MRAPFQILAIPCRLEDKRPVYCVFHRADHDQWQFVAGGGEGEEQPMEAAMREVFEETGLVVEKICQLDSLCFIPCSIFPESITKNWPEDTFVIPEYAFGFVCEENIRLSGEHTGFVWMSYEEALKILRWDSNKTALYELNARLIR